MNTARLTTTQILNALRTSSDSAAWEAFSSRFGPTVEAFARKLGLNETDAADVAQETLAEFVEHYQAGRYDRTKGRLGSWVMGIARHRILDLRRRAARRREHRGESALAELPSDENLSVIFDDEYQRVLFERAMTELRGDCNIAPKMWQIFDLYAYDKVAAETVAAQCAVSVDEVYRAKNRILTRLRQRVADLQSLEDEPDRKLA